MGCVYRRGKFYWIKYYRNGKPISESSKSDKKAVAERLLKLKEGEIAQGRNPSIIFDKVGFEELVEDYITDYRINNRSTLAKAERCADYLLQEFGGMKASQITTPIIQRYTLKRLDEGLANATINRELAALKRMFNLAAKATPPKAAHVPHIPMLRENNVRKGFFEHDAFLRLRDALPDYLKPVVTFAYHTGWRRSEIFGLTWRNVDLKEGVVRLDPGETKNGDGRTIYLEPELMDLFKEARRKRRMDCVLVFHRNGRRLNDIRYWWKKACLAASVPDMLFHDLRRTAVRNMVRAGIPERVAMTISGHKTRSVFDRYNIVSPEDLIEAARKRHAFSTSQTDGYNLVTFGPISDKRRKRSGS